MFAEYTQAQEDGESVHGQLLDRPEVPAEGVEEDEEAERPVAEIDGNIHVRSVHQNTEADLQAHEDDVAGLVRRIERLLAVIPLREATTELLVRAVD